MKATSISVETLQKVYVSNAELRLSEFKEIVETAGHRLTGRWNRLTDCPEIVPMDRSDKSGFSDSSAVRP